MKRILCVISVLLLVCAAPLAAGTEALSASVVIDWFSGSIRAHITLDMIASGLRLPSERYEAERRLIEAVPDIVRPFVLSITLDSARTVMDSVSDRSLDPAQLETFLENGQASYIAMSRDMASLNALYEWKLADLTALYVRHNHPVDMPEVSRSVPTRAYTGIVIYAEGLLKVKGEYRTGRIQPCLFPTLYDEAMNVIMERNRVYPDALKTWGSAAYCPDINAADIEARAGDYPLRIMAKELFGTLRGDIVINSADALKILCSAENRELIQRGNVVFIIGKP